MISDSEQPDFVRYRNTRAVYAPLFKHAAHCFTKASHGEYLTEEESKVLMTFAQAVDTFREGLYHSKEPAHNAAILKKIALQSMGPSIDKKLIDPRGLESRLLQFYLCAKLIVSESKVLYAITNPLKQQTRFQQLTYYADLLEKYATRLD